MFEVADTCLASDQFDSFGHSLVRFVILMTAVPRAETGFVRPEGEQPDFLGAIERTDDLHSAVSRCIVHQMRPSTERGLHFGAHAIRDDKAAEHYIAGRSDWRNVRGGWRSSSRDLQGHSCLAPVLGCWAVVRYCLGQFLKLGGRTS